MRIGLPKGRLIAVSEHVLEQLQLTRASSSHYRIAGADLTVWLLKMCDIPKLVASGHLDVGLAPTEWVEESGRGCERLSHADGYPVRVSILARPEWRGRLAEASSLRVATEYPNIARRHLADRVAQLSVVEVHGSAEAYPPELADVVVDSVETGATAESHGLVEVERLFECAIHVIVRRGAARDQRRAGDMIGAVVEH
jgi:ATP phosphoribosyltransferase